LTPAGVVQIVGDRGVATSAQGRLRHGTMTV
jgi:hypothetical protein